MYRPAGERIPASWKFNLDGTTGRRDDGTTVDVVTPASPMGRVLVGASVGDVVELERGGSSTELSVEAVA